MNTQNRIFPLIDFLQPSPGTPIRSVVLETEQAVVVAWHVAPGQEIAAHIHPNGQDTWTVIAGRAVYYLGDGQAMPLKTGDITIAKSGEVHGALNVGSEPFIFVSVVTGSNAGFQLAGK